MHPRPAPRPPRCLLPFLAAVLLLLCPPWTGAADDAPGAAPRVATVKTLDGPATVERAGRTLALGVGMDLFVSDTVVTGAASTAGLTFEDEALVSLGPGSRLLIDRFRFDPATQGGEFESTLSRGRMAVVSGRIAKSQVDAMKVRTPAALLGVRGTEFVVDAGP
jgi:hypothetical protein